MSSGEGLVVKRIGIEKARRRLRDATRHADRLAVLANGIDVPAFEHEWFLAISAINSVHEILRTSAFKSAGSRQWFTSVEKHVIRKDPLLRYILHARGADHHGVTAGTSPDVSGAEYLGYSENSGVEIRLTKADGTLEVSRPGAIILAGECQSFTFRYKLVPVVDDRDQTVYAPPVEHLGRSLFEIDPVSIVRIALAYYDQILDKSAPFLE